MRGGSPYITLKNPRTKKTYKGSYGTIYVKVTPGLTYNLKGTIYLDGDDGNMFAYAWVYYSQSINNTSSSLDFTG